MPSRSLDRIGVEIFEENVLSSTGQSATHAVVYAKLITSDGKDQGLHPFIIPVRCAKSLRPFPGVIVGDIGEKIGLNGIDNGYEYKYYM